MEHTYYLYKRGGSRGNGTAMGMDVKSIHTLIFHQEIEHSHSVHVGKDTSMSHYFKFKEY